MSKSCDLSAKEIADVVKACKRAGVSSLKYKGLVLEFGAEPIDLDSKMTPRAVTSGTDIKLRKPPEVSPLDNVGNFSPEEERDIISMIQAKLDPREKYRGRFGDNMEHFDRYLQVAASESANAMYMDPHSYEESELEALDG